ncbi:hypothetical protein BDR26DRAFT_804036 [Obelidium mucronatum]|nr:hypothetical protein BDR26DRAFT_804036 [Obelidium mucronatum]
MDDDWLEDDSDFRPTETSVKEPDSSAQEREFLALQRIHGTNGYREGLGEGKEKSMQEGFDAGYNAGFAEGLSQGLSLGHDTAKRLLESLRSK